MANLRMNDDLNIVAESPLVIEKLGDDLNIIQKLDDEPNDVGGMTSTELKETFDRSGNLIKAFINDKLIPAVLASDATEAARAAAETAREQAEAARKTAETAREQAETAREEHETIRVRQEQERVAAEQARDEAEKARVDSTTGIVAQATTQADAAKTAAQGAARDAEAAAQDAMTAAAAAQGAAQDAGDAEASAGSAAKSEQAAQTASAASQSWAAGGTGTRPDEETNNAKYWAGVAEKAAGGGVTSFNGRAGVVTPQKGDYTAEMVGARPETWTPGAADVNAVPTSEKGQPNGVATLDQGGKVPEAQLPERLSKQNLLSDETAGLYPGLPKNPAPDDVLEILSKAVLYKDANLVTPGGAAVPRVKMVYGTYTGNSGASVTLNAGFKPKCVIVLGDRYNLWAIGGDFNSVHSVLLWIEGITTSYFTQRTSTSYTQTDTSLIINPASVNENGRKYSYVILG